MGEAMHADGGNALQMAIKSSSALKTDVMEAFAKLASGLQSSHGDAKENSFFVDVQKSFLGVYQHMKELEDSVGSLNPPPSGQLSIGNAQLIAQDFGVDKFELYSEMVRSYTWIDKMHEYSNLAHYTSNQHSSKKSNSMNALASKKRRSLVSHNVPPQNVDNTISCIEKQFKDMSIVLTRPFGSNAILHVTLSRVLIAVIVMKGLMIESVLVRGFDESFYGEDGKSDPWTPSRHAVFRKVTESANAAMLNYYSPLMPELCVRSFLTWFHSYLKLFSEVCKKCGMHLNNNMPSTWRDFRGLDAFHEACKP